MFPAVPEAHIALYDHPDVQVPLIFASCGRRRVDITFVTLFVTFLVPLMCALRIDPMVGYSFVFLM